LLQRQAPNATEGPELWEGELRNWWKPTARLVEAGKINLEPLITQRIALDDLMSKGFKTRSYAISLATAALLPKLCGRRLPA